MIEPNRRNNFQLKPWSEIVGKLNAISTDDQHLYVSIDEKILVFSKDSEEALYIKDKIDGFMGKSIAIIRTDVPDKPFLVRFVSKGS